MTGVRTIVVIATRKTTGTDASSSPSVTVVSRLSGKKTSQIVVACFQRGGAVRPAVDGVPTSPATGSSNQPRCRSVVPSG